MKIRLIFILILPACLLIHCTNKTGKDNLFRAYYTNVGSKTEITGKFVDIIVRIDDDKKLVFCKESAYLPYLEIGNDKQYVKEIIKLSNKSSTNIDEFNKYSYVRIIENTEDKIIVHRRYIPDLRNIGFRSVVHEYYILTPEMKVRRIIKAGNMNLDIYNNPKSRIIQEMKIKSNGIHELSMKDSDLTFEPHKPIKGTDLKGEPPQKPVAWWKFDEGLSESDDNTFESIEKIKCPITGNVTLWKKGISGTALAFDGYDSKVVMQPDNAHFFNDDFTIDAWIVLGAYPWEWAPVIDYTADDKYGLYFGVNSNGHAGIMLIDGKKEAELISHEQIPLYKWTHVAVSFNRSNNMIVIYVDGEKSGESRTDEIDFTFNHTDMYIGLNKKPRKASDHVSRDYPPHIRTPLGNQARIYGIEGLIDEVKIFDRALGDKQIIDLYNIVKPTKSLKNDPDLEKRILPGEVDGSTAENFEAYYTSLKYHELWDNLWRSSDYPDVVVKFDELPVSIIYWRGTNYGPSYVTENNIWMSDQSSETGTEYGCAEHMADKQNRYSHVRILENTPARIVVHWRYASADITYKLADEKSWTDEYHYIYPDGTLLRYVHWYTGEEGFQDLQFLAAPGTKQEDNISLRGMTIANSEGDVQVMDWSDGIPETRIDHATIARINFKSEYKVFAVFPKEVNNIHAWGKRERAYPDTYFAGPWNHWPVGQMPNDGRYAMHTDRVTSSALGGSNPRYMAMYGFTNNEIDSLISVEKSWNYPPGISDVTGGESIGYQREEKAFLFAADSSELLFNINASENSPVVNPCFVVTNWCNGKQAGLKIDGSAVDDGKLFRQGIVIDEKGEAKLILWIAGKFCSPLKIEIFCKETYTFK